MKIEKINENQIRCTISNEELSQRNLKASELAYGSDKARILLEEMMIQASIKYDFIVDKNNPVMIEAMSGPQGIILTITKDIKEKAKKKIQSDLYRIYQFNKMSDIIRAAKVLKGINFGQTTLCRDDKTKDYLLVTMKSNLTIEQFATVNNMFLEFGSNVLCDAINLAYITEHCNVIIPNNAIEKLGMM